MCVEVGGEGRRERTIYRVREREKKGLEEETVKSKE